MPPSATNKNEPSRVGGSIPSRATSSQEEDSRDTPGQNAVIPWGFELWQHLHQEHGLTLTESEIQEIVRLAEPLTDAAEANTELIERLRDRTDSYLAAEARNVQTIQQQAVMLARLTATLDNIIESIPLVERSSYAEVINRARLDIKAVMKGAPEA